MSQEPPVESLRRTPLYDQHRALGAMMVPFGGWEMPVRYTGDIEEHQAVRQAAGLFDVSHMGEFRVTGPGARTFVQRMVANDIDAIAPGRALYTQFTRPDGGTVDDLLVYALPDGAYWLVVNAGNIAKDWAWLQAHLAPDVTLADESDQTAMLALQGPRASTVLQTLVPDAGAVAGLRAFHWFDAPVAGIPARIARTGYTGEDGFELFCEAGRAGALWDAVLAAGQAHGLKPAGLGARDTLRLEAGLPLYGHELSDEISPVAAGYGWSVKPQKGEFLGQAVLARQKAGDLPRRVVGLRMAGKQIARQGYPVMQGDRPVGVVLSGTYSPTLQGPIATALVDREALEGGEPLGVRIRQAVLPANIVPLPFYRRSP